MNTAYSPRIASPYQQVVKKHPFDISAKNHPVRREIMKHVGKYDLAVTFNEDAVTTGMLNIPGLIAFICQIEQNGKVIGIGRSNAVINETSKYFERIIQSASNYSLIDAVSKMTRTIETLRTDPIKQSYDYEKEAMLDDALKTRDSYRAEEMATDKQKDYLLQLIHTNITNKDERTLRESQIAEFTRTEASRAIASFQK